MGISVVQTKVVTGVSLSGNNSSDSVTISLDTAATVGNVLVVLPMVVGTGEFPYLRSVTDDGSNTWSDTSGPEVATGNSTGLNYYLADVRYAFVSTSATDIEVTCSHTSAWTADGKIVVIELQGGDSATLYRSNYLTAAASISVGRTGAAARRAYVLANGVSDAAKELLSATISPPPSISENESFADCDQIVVGAGFAADIEQLFSITHTTTGDSAYVYLVLYAKAPTIDTQPANQSKNVAQDATFSVSATASSGSLTYQWQDEAGNISGATSSSLTLANVPKKLSGTKYRVKATDSNDTIISDWATLTVSYVDPVSGLYVVCYDASMSAPTAEQIANGLQADDDWAAGAATEALRSTTGTQTFQDPITDLTPGVEYKLSFTAVLE